MNSEFKLITQRQAATESYRLLQKSRRRNWSLAGVSMGIHSLNLALGGWIPQKVTVFSGRSGQGKSSLLQAFFTEGSKVRDKRCAHFLCFTWEMTSSLFVTREICRRMGIEQALILNAAKLIGDERMKEIDAIYKDVSEINVEYQQVSTNKDVIVKMVNEFVERCKVKEKEQDIEIQPVVIIDFIQMASLKGSGSRTYQLQDLMVAIKQNANETGASYGILSQLQREADSQALPVISNISDSKSLEENSDNVLLMFRAEKNNQPFIINPQTGQEVDSKDTVLWRIAKSRDFGTRDILDSCQIKYFRFFGYNSTWDTEYHHLYNQKSFWLDHFKLNKKNEPDPELDLQLKESKLNH